MNNSEIGATFVAMCNGTKEVKQIIGRNHLHIYPNYLGGVSLYSYSTPIAVYDGTKVVINQTFLSASTAKHQSTILSKCFNCPVSIVLHFGGWGCSDNALLKQAAPLYSYQKQVFEAANGRKYTRFVLRRQASPTDNTVYNLHRYTSEQAAKDEMSRLNRLAVAAA